MDYGKLLLSRAAFDASRNTVRLQRQRATMTREGLWYFDRYDDNTQTEEQVATNFAVVIQGALCASVSTEPSAMDRSRLRKEAVASNQGVGLRKLIRLAQEKQVELILLFYPTHVLMSEVQRRCQGPEGHWNWIWHIVFIATQETGSESQQLQVWQFADYTPMNGERIHAPECLGQVFKPGEEQSAD